MSTPKLRSLERTWSVTREAVVRYAGASLDFNDIHLDDGAGRRAGYDGAIAHGMLTMGQVLAAAADELGPTAVTACRSRFGGPVPLGASLTAEVARPDQSSLAVTVRDAAGAQVLAVDVELDRPAPAEPLHGDVVAEQVLVVERGPAARFAAAVGARGSHYFDATAAERTGLQGIPVVPTFAFALPGWGWFPDRQAGGPGEPPDPVRDCRAWTGTDGAVIHAGQDFAYHRPLYVGDVVRSTSHVVRRFSKHGRSGDLHFTVVAHRLLDEAGRPVVTSVTTMLVKDDG